MGMRGVKAFARGRHATSSLFDRDWRSVLEIGICILGINLTEHPNF